jgi:hypothetical protein
MTPREGTGVLMMLAFAGTGRRDRGRSFSEVLPLVVPDSDAASSSSGVQETFDRHAQGLLDTKNSFQS